MTINLNGCSVTLALLAQIATALESGEAVTISNAAIPANGPGIGAFLLGQATALAMLEKRFKAIEPALSGRAGKMSEEVA